MVLVVAVGRVVAVRLSLPRVNDGVVGIATVLLVETRIDTPVISELPFACSRSSIMLRNCCWLISRSGMADSGQIISCEWPICGWVSAAGFQGIDQLLFVPFHGLWISPCTSETGRAPQQLIPLDIAQRERQGEQQRGNASGFQLRWTRAVASRPLTTISRKLIASTLHHRRAFQRPSICCSRTVATESRSAPSRAGTR